MMVLTVLVVPVANASPISVSQNSKITTEVGPTTDLGGGNHFYVKFGSDAAFGILWGTNETHNNIYFVSYISRYLGSVNVNEPNGTVLAQKPLKIYTLYAVKLDRLIEYNGSNGNAILNYTPQIGNATNFTQGLGLEQIYKGVNLNTAWTASNWQNGTENGNLTWNFTLTATNLSYNAPLRYVNDSKGEVLKSIALTFHLTASTNHVSNVSVPQYNVTMTKGLLGNDQFNKLQKGDNLTVSGNVTSYHVKWDKNITGWIADSKDKNPTIMAEYGILVENYIPPAVTGLMALAACQKVIQATGDNGTMTAGTQTLNGTASIGNAFSLKTPRLTFGGENTKIGTFEWVQNVTVNNKTENATSQVTAMMPFNVRFGGNDFYGFAAIVGISYPYGQSIVQDPDISSQALTEVELTTPSTVTGISPTGSGVSVNANINVQFSGAMNESSVNMIVNGVNEPLSWNGNNGTFTPTSSLAYNTTFSVNVSGNDVYGNIASTVWAFTTIKDEGIIEGTIIDMNDAPLANVVVMLGNGMTTTTDANGHYEFDNVTAGSYKLTANMTGFQGITLNDVSTSAGKTTNLSPLNLEAISSSASSSNNGLLIPMVVIVILALLGVGGYLVFMRKKK
jgi:hypothetical protein